MEPNLEIGDDITEEGIWGREKFHSKRLASAFSIYFFRSPGFCAIEIVNSKALEEGGGVHREKEDELIRCRRSLLPYIFNDLLTSLGPHRLELIGFSPIILTPFSFYTNLFYNCISS